MSEADKPVILEAGGAEIATRAGGARRYRKPLSAFRWSDITLLLRESFDHWTMHKGPRLGASLAFYTLLSLTPLLLVIVSIAGLVFGRPAAEAQILWEVEDMVGPAGTHAIGSLLEGAEHTTHGILATVLGLLALLFGASGVLVELRDALNTIWEVPAPAQTGLKSLIQLAKERLFSFALVIATGFLLVVSLIVNAWLAALGRFAEQVLPAPEGVLEAANAIISFLVITGLFAAIYRIMPDRRIEWRDVALGATVTSLLFTVGKVLIGLYLGKATFASTYGAAASIVVLLVWVYYSGQIFFLGAEFTKAFADRYGSKPATILAPQGR
jgi:membrane protein